MSLRGAARKSGDWNIKTGREEKANSFRHAFDTKLVRARSLVGSKLKILLNMSSGSCDIWSICSSAIAETHGRLSPLQVIIYKKSIVNSLSWVQLGWKIEITKRKRIGNQSQLYTNPTLIISYLPNNVRFYNPKILRLFDLIPELESYFNYNDCTER